MGLLWRIENIPFLASFFVGVRKWIFRPLHICDIWIQREWIWIGWEYIEREREPIIFLIWQRTLKERHNISEASQYFGKIWFWYEKTYEVGFNLSLAEGPQMLFCYVFMFSGACQRFFFAGKIRTEDRRTCKKHMYVFLSFYVFFAHQIKTKLGTKLS